MAKPRDGARHETRGEADKRAGFASVRPGALGLAAVALALILTGCSELKNTLTAGIDPLLGGPALRPSGQTTPLATTGATAVPPLSTGSSLSNAALATAPPRSLDSGRDLRIGTPGGNAANNGWAGQAPALVSNGSGAVLRGPEPATEPATPRAEAPVYNPVSYNDSKSTTYEQAQNQLRARGVLWQRLEMIGDNGAWKFSCSMPNRQNPKLRRTYEGQAPDYLAAMRAVLEQIDREQ